MKGVGALLAVAVGLGGCSSVKLVQREGCWVRRTERLGAVREELGPCMRAPSPWAEDRLTRLVQECAVQVDHRWETAALDAWSHGRPVPPQAGEDSVLQTCLGDALRTVVPENETLKNRLADVSGDRDGLRARAERDHGNMQASLDRLAEYLGEAAKKASPPATATATATSEGRQRSESASEPAAPAAPMVVATAPGSATAACAPEQPGAARPVRARAARRPVRCDPPVAGAKDAVTGAGAQPEARSATTAPAAQPSPPAVAR
jgi:hypothetical protein